MGIKGLTALITEHAPHAIKQHDIKSLFGRKVAVDASMSLYQFLIAVRQQDGQSLMNEQGETTSHLLGMFYRTIRMVENDLKPCFVFDGKAPELKQNIASRMREAESQLKKRFSRREEAKEDEAEAKETGTVEDVDRFNRRQVRVTPQHNDECKKLLTLMGIPWINAPGEAEAQCAELCRGNLVYGAGSEDMDTLTFNSPILVRHLTFSEARKMPIEVISLQDVLEGFNLTMDKFIEMCMLCGCDYLEPVKGIGAKTALKLVQEYDSFGDIVAHLRKGKNPPPEDWPWEDAKKLFQKPDVTPAEHVTLEWKAPDVEGLVEFLVKDKGFAEDRVRKGADKLKARLAAKQQGRLDNFFTMKPKPPSDTKRRQKNLTLLTPQDDKKDGGKSKKAKTAASAGKKKK
ncbi:Elongation of fatty acids protein 2 [Microbotryomycetes sp. JL201]|nr:Elongation of fatty acids protein 2 [Microbotryomycetes sp. JL201]